MGLKERLGGRVLYTKRSAPTYGRLWPMAKDNGVDQHPTWRNLKKPPERLLRPLQQQRQPDRITYHLFRHPQRYLISVRFEHKIILLQLKFRNFLSSRTRRRIARGFSGPSSRSSPSVQRRGGLQRPVEDWHRELFVQYRGLFSRSRRWVWCAAVPSRVTCSGAVSHRCQSSDTKSQPRRGRTALGF